MHSMSHHHRRCPLFWQKQRKIAQKQLPAHSLLQVQEDAMNDGEKNHHKISRRSICHVLTPNSPDDWSHTTKVIGRLSKRFIVSLKYNCFNLLMAFYQDLSETAVRSKLHHLMKSKINTDKIILQVGALSQSRWHEQVTPPQNHCSVEQDPPPSSQRLLL